MNNLRTLDDKLLLLKELSSKLNELDILWGLGGSTLLYYHGIVDTTNDIDFLVSSVDLDKLQILLKDYEYEVALRNDFYTTKYLYKLKVNNIDVDIMVDFGINSNGVNYVYPLNEFRIDEVEIDGVTIKLLLLEDWLKAYKLIGRKEKVTLIKKHLINR